MSGTKNHISRPLMNFRRLRFLKYFGSTLKQSGAKIHQTPRNMIFRLLKTLKCRTSFPGPGDFESFRYTTNDHLRCEKMMKIDFFVCAQDTSEYVFLAFLGILKHIWSGFERYLAYFQPWIAEFWLLKCVLRQVSLEIPT